MWQIRTVTSMYASFFAAFVLMSHGASVTHEPGSIGSPPQKYLIEFGWDIPDESFILEHWREMDERPFDVVVVQPHYPTEHGAWRHIVFGRERLQRLQYEKLLLLIKALRVAKFKNLRHNFLLITMNPDFVDWFDGDWQMVFHNFRLAARAAKKASLKGIFLDTETYQFHLYNYYSEQKHRDTRSFAEYAKRAKVRGVQLMRAINKEHANITIIFTIGWEATFESNTPEAAPIEGAYYGLLGPFLDGFLVGASPQTTLVDGHEFSYRFNSRESFLSAYHALHNTHIALSSEPDLYRARLQVGFGIWLEPDSQRGRWDLKDLSKNYFTPQQIEEKDVGKTQRFYAPDYDDSSWKEISIGRSFEEQGYDYDGVAWYRVRFRIPPVNKNVTLWFGGISDSLTVYLNGRPFSITNLLKAQPRTVARVRPLPPTSTKRCARERTYWQFVSSTGVLPVV